MDNKGISTDLTDLALALAAVLILGAIASSFMDTLLLWYSKTIGAYYQWFLREKLAIAAAFSIADLFLLAFIYKVSKKTRKVKQGLAEEDFAVDLQRESRFSFIPLEKETAESWRHIQELSDSSNPSDWNMAVLQADALLNDILMHLGYEGDSIVERLKLLDPRTVKSLDKLWSAHRLRNQIAHNSMAKYSKETIMNALEAYLEALQELGVLKVEQSRG